MKEPVVDLDRIDTWPANLYAEVSALVPQVVDERKNELSYLRNRRSPVDRPPDQPATESALAIVEEAFEQCQIRFFHATRLLDFDAVRTGGLRPLDIRERLDALRALLRDERLIRFRDRFEMWIADADLEDLGVSSRAGQVWGTPLRRYLNYDHCGVFYRQWGGEAVERLTRQFDPGLTNALRTFGTPAVVIARMPAFGFCSSSRDRLPKTVIDLTIEKQTKCQPVDGWDIMTLEAVSPDWIEAVVEKDDLRVASPFTALPLAEAKASDRRI